MELPFFWVDAFTEKAFGGNPAAVVPLDSWPEDALLQRMANQHGLSETAFFVRTATARAQLRWFTPAVEVDLCGHATLAAAHVLFAELGQRESPIVFDTQSGPLPVHRKGTLYELDFPARPAHPASPPTELLKGLGCAPALTFKAERMWLCVYATQAEVLALSPDHALLSGVIPGRIIATAPGIDADFVSRFFAPDAGVPEDPVTGSAHSTLVPYWAARLAKTKLFARQVSRRGGELWCELAGDRVRIAGRAATYIRRRASF